jgi:hypothetical protein
MCGETFEAHIARMTKTTRKPNASTRGSRSGRTPIRWQQPRYVATSPVPWTRSR